MRMAFDLDKCERELAIRGWYQKDIAKKTGWSRSVVAKFFRGEVVRNKVAFDIVKALGLDMEDVYFDEPVTGGRKRA